MRLTNCHLAVMLKITFGLFLLGFTPAAFAGELWIGTSSTSITPKSPIALAGQMHTRIAASAESDVTANVLALESRVDGSGTDQAIFVSLDLVAIHTVVNDAVRKQVKARLGDFDVSKLVLSATHTHTAPVTNDGQYLIPHEGVMQPPAYVDFLADRVAEAVEKAWKSRAAGSVGWGLGHAVVAQNRRAVYSNGEAKMYGGTNEPAFRNIEGPEDQGVEVLFFWNAKKELIGTAVNVACPAQEVEGGSLVNADFWHEIRVALQAAHGKDLVVLGWTGAAGDQSPHLMYRKTAEERMRKLRGVTRLQELANRVVAAWEEAYAGAKKEMFSDVPLVHRVKRIELPARVITKGEADQARAKVAEYKRDAARFTLVGWHQTVVDRFEQQSAGKNPPYVMELHAVRLGDIAIATNDFELFTDFGIQMKAKSKALQTFVIQLAGPGSYVPTEKAKRGGGYSAIAESSIVGPEGGQSLADQTVEALNALWPQN